MGEKGSVWRESGAAEKTRETFHTGKDGTEWALFKTETGSPRGLVSHEARTKGLLSESLLPKAGSSVAIGSA